MERDSGENLAVEMNYTANKYTRDTSGVSSYAMKIPESSAERYKRKKETGEVIINFDKQAVPIKTSSRKKAQAQPRDHTTNSSSSSSSMLFPSLVMFGAVLSVMWWKKKQNDFMTHSEGAVTSPTVISDHIPSSSSSRSEQYQPHTSEKTSINTAQSSTIINEKISRKKIPVTINNNTRDVIRGESRQESNVQNTVSSTNIVTPLWLQRPRSE